MALLPEKITKTTKNYGYSLTKGKTALTLFSLCI